MVALRESGAERGEGEGFARNGGGGATEVELVELEIGVEIGGGGEGAGDVEIEDVVTEDLPDIEIVFDEEGGVGAEIRLQDFAEPKVK